MICLTRLTYDEQYFVVRKQTKLILVAEAIKHKLITG